MSETLKPCPFCGEEAIISENDTIGLFSMECSRKCFLHGKHIWAEDILEACLIWNKRAKLEVDEGKEISEREKIPSLISQLEVSERNIASLEKVALTEFSFTRKLAERIQKLETKTQHVPDPS